MKKNMVGLKKTEQECERVIFTSRCPLLWWTVGVWGKHGTELRVRTWVTEVLGFCAFGAEDA